MMLKVGIGITLCILLTGSVFAKTTNTVKRVVKLEPRIRIEPLVDNAAILPIENIRPFLETSLILDSKQQFSCSPYIIAENESRVEGGTGTVIYVKGIEDVEEFEYIIYRGGKTYTHPVTKELLGFEAMAIGAAELKTFGEPAVLEVKNAKECIEVGDRVLPHFTSELPTTLTLRPVGEIAEDGYILSVRDGTNQIGRNQVVVISLGQRDGIEEGNILDIYQTGRAVLDPYSKGWQRKKIQLPDNRVGNLLVFQSFDKLSLALVLEATEIVRLRRADARRGARP